MDHVIISKQCRERFFDQQQFARFEDWKIFLGGLSDLRQQYVIRKQTSGYHMVVMTTGGKGIWKRENYPDTELLPGSVLLVPAYSSIHYELEQGRPWQMAWFMLYPDPIWQSFPQHLTLISQCDGQSSLVNVLHNLADEVHNRDANSLLLQRLYAEQIFLLITRLIEQSSQPGRPHERLKSLLHEVEVSVSKPWNIECLCRYSHYSRAQLNRIFQQSLGTSPRQKVMEIKMNHAALLLRTTHLAIKQIAQRVGFDNPYNFSNRFKQIVGQSPSLYRQAHNRLKREPFVA
jgi:AraC-like DNA-binding protein